MRRERVAPQSEVIRAILVEGSPCCGGCPAPVRRDLRPCLIPAAAAGGGAAAAAPRADVDLRDEVLPPRQDGRRVRPVCKNKNMSSFRGQAKTQTTEDPGENGSACCSPATSPIATPGKPSGSCSCGNMGVVSARSHSCTRMTTATQSEAKSPALTAAAGAGLAFDWLASSTDEPARWSKTLHKNASRDCRVVPSR